jgi:sugar transferase (PEP-CTERM/EpsH1 system associated)
MNKKTSRIRVVHLVTALEVGGLERVVFDLTRSLNREEFEPSILCLQDAGPLALQCEAAGIRVHALGCMGQSRVRTALRLASRLLQLRPHILHTHNPIPHFHGLAAAAGASVPVLVHTKHGRNRPELPRLVILNRLAAYLSSCVVPVSYDAAQVARRIERVPARKLCVIRNGIDTSIYYPLPRRPAGPPRAIHVARLNLIKDQKTLLKAARLVANASPDFRLDIVGDGPEREVLYRLCDEWKLGEHVVFLGERDDVKDLLRAANLFVLSSSGEGLSLTLLEAMATGLPVVATRVGGNPEVVIHGKTGLLVPAESPSALAEAILSLWRDPAHARQLGEAGRRRVEVEFDLRQVTVAYERLYRKLLARKRPAPSPGSER